MLHHNRPDATRRAVLAGFAAAGGATLLPRTASAAVPVIFAAGVDPAYTPFYVAMQSKLFADSGIDFQLQKFTQGGDAVDAVAAGLATFSGAGEQTTMIRMARTELRALAIYESTGRNMKLVARKGIGDPHQIKSIGVVVGSVSEYCTYLMFEKLGIDPATVKIVRSGPPELPALLARGDVDAYFVWEPWAKAGTKLGANVLLTSGDIGYVSTLWLTTSRTWLENNGPVARKFVDGIREACDRIRKDPRAAAEAVRAEIKMAPEDALPLMAEAEFEVRDFTEIDLASFDRIAKFLHDRKATPELLDYRRQMVPGFAKA